MKLLGQEKFIKYEKLFKEILLYGYLNVKVDCPILQNLVSSDIFITFPWSSNSLNFYRKFGMYLDIQIQKFFFINMFMKHILLIILLYWFCHKFNDMSTSLLLHRYSFIDFLKLYLQWNIRCQKFWSAFYRLFLKSKTKNSPAILVSDP